MNTIEKYSDRELQEMQEVCRYSWLKMDKNSKEEGTLSDIFQIALIEINRELDERKIRKEIAK